MTSLVHYVSSGSEEDVRYVMVDDKKKRRMMSNRESARRSRMRKQQHLDSLVNQVTQLQKEKNDLVQNINATSQLYLQMASENSVLNAQVMELGERLQSLNSVLTIFQEVSGFSMDIPQIPDPLLKPWQIPCPSQPIMASANMLRL